ncbi:hypothetical protein NT6N_22360 [Oceaniferula spumae]|uniref:Ice-binding protein C-terminal domain-containing protein n=1 Tax=Oceaniferula spumae TaxID=2979115 RepID=A0AAT9FMG6_9BACT
MKSKHTLHSALAFTLSLTAAEAVVTNIDLQMASGEFGNRTLTSEGTIGFAPGSGNVSNSGGADQSITYRISGLSLDNFGTGDDSVDITLGLFATSNGAVTGMGTAFGHWGVNGSLVSPTQTITFTIDEATVNLGAGGTETATVAINGFSAFNLLNVAANERYSITGTVANNVTGADPVQDVPNQFTGTEQAFTYGGNVGDMRVGELQSSITITSVPEPSSAALFGLGGLALILRRCK